MEKQFCALGRVAEAFLVGAAAAGVSKLSTSPPVFLRTLVEAEIAARDASNAATTRCRQAGFP